MMTINTVDDYETMLCQRGRKFVYVKSDWCADCAYADVFWPYIETLYPHTACHVINRDTLPELTTRLRVTGVPSYLVYEDDHEVARYVDTQRKTFEQVKAFLDAAIAKGSDR